MFPLKDDNPTQTKPIVTIALIAICVCIFLYQFSLLHSENTLIINIFGISKTKTDSIKIKFIIINR